MIRKLSLADESRGLSSVVFPRPGVALQNLAIDPAVREVTEPRPGRDGNEDSTQYMDVAAVSLTLRLYGSTRALLAEFGAFMAPFARPYLVVSDSEWGADRRIRLRLDAFTKPIETGAGLTRNVLMQFKAPDGVMESADAATVYLSPDLSNPGTGVIVTAALGVVVTAAAGVTVNASDTSGQSIVPVNGDLRSSWTALLYGPCTGPALTNASTGETLAFTDRLSLRDGEYILVNSADRSAYYMSDPFASQLSYVDFSGGRSSWWQFQPGDNLVTYSPKSAQSGARAQVTFRHTWIP